jgi:hypothetical protein
MPERRFPPLFSAPSIAAAVFSLLVVLTGLFILGNASPFWLMTRDPGSRFAMLTLIVVAAAGAVGLYVLSAPRMWTFTRRYTPAAHGQQHLPEHLVSACLADIDFACPGCTYNLRGLKGSVCPECSTPVVVYLYGTQKTSTKWTALIICWLSLALVAGAVTLGAVWGDTMQLLAGRGWWGSHSETELGVIFTTASVVVLVSSWRAVALAVPKPPHRQSIAARRTAVWLAGMSAACCLALAIVFGERLLRAWY